MGLRPEVDGRKPPGIQEGRSLGVTWSRTRVPFQDPNTKGEQTCAVPTKQSPVSQPA